MLSYLSKETYSKKPEYVTGFPKIVISYEPYSILNSFEFQFWSRNQKKIKEYLRRHIFPLITKKICFKFYSIFIINHLNTYANANVYVMLVAAIYVLRVRFLWIFGEEVANYYLLFCQLHHNQNLYLYIRILIESIKSEVILIVFQKILKNCLKQIETVYTLYCRDS